MQWVLGVVGVVLLGVLCDVLLPAGQMNKYVKGIFTVLLLFVLIAPVATFFRQESSLSSLLDFDLMGYQSDAQDIQIIEPDPLSILRTRYPTVYRLEWIDGMVHVYVDGAIPTGLARYVCIVCGVDPEEVMVYGQDG